MTFAEESTRSLDRADLIALDAAERLEALRRYLREVYAEATGQQAPSADEPLYVESIAAIQFQVIVETDLGVSLRLHELAETPTLDVLAETIERAVRTTDPVDASEVAVLVVDEGGRFEPFGLTDVQHAYWLGRGGLFELGDVATHLYLEFESVEFDVVRAEGVLRRLVERHEMLRCVVRSDGRQQVLGEVGEVRVGFEDLSGLSVEDAGVRVAAVRDELSHEVRPADVWPLFEFRAQRLPGGVFRVHVSVDLLVADASSIRVLLGEWARLWVDVDAELPSLGLSFRDYVLSVGAVSEGAAVERAREYWLGRVESLAAAPELPLVPVVEGAATRFVRREFRLDGVRWGRLKEAAAGLGVTPSVVLLAAYAEVLGLWAKNPRFTVNLTVGERLPVHADVGNVVGDFTGLVLCEVDVSVGASFVERARAVQERLWEDLEHRGFGGVRVLRELARVHG
ncbi:condensation domain-containing protein, partial [Actinomadura sp. KC216]|uniref:condensation domain-containing protein n=1 Tax=Actinomadura sp. KC216 TaxID=2530370 RepID=UPI001FB5A314